MHPFPCSRSSASQSCPFHARNADPCSNKVRLSSASTLSSTLSLVVFHWRAANPFAFFLLRSAHTKDTRDASNQDYVMFVWALKAIVQPSPRFRNTRRFQLVGFAEGFRP